jgi:hypothetical protein
MRVGLAALVPLLTQLCAAMLRRNAKSFTFTSFTQVIFGSDSTVSKALRVWRMAEPL